MQAPAWLLSTHQERSHLVDPDEHTEHDAVAQERLPKATAPTQVEMPSGPGKLIASSQGSNKHGVYRRYVFKVGSIKLSAACIQAVVHDFKFKMPLISIPCGRHASSRKPSLSCQVAGLEIIELQFSADVLDFFARMCDCEDKASRAFKVCTEYAIRTIHRTQHYVRALESKTHLKPCSLADSHARRRYT